MTWMQWDVESTHDSNGGHQPRSVGVQIGAMTAASDHIADTVKLSRPAHQALTATGIVTYADLGKWTRKQLADLHGIGPKTFVFLEPAMNERGVAFKP
jgi:hypothetical protein